jgi:hypothetical protein
LRAQSEGKKNSTALHQVKILAGLTDAEEATLTSVATACLAGFDASRQSANALVTQFKAQNPAGTPVPLSLQQQFESFKGQELQGILEAVQQIQTSFGEARFQNLDNYVRSSLAKGIKPGPATLQPGRPSGLNGAVPASH